MRRPPTALLGLAVLATVLTGCATTSTAASPATPAAARPTAASPTAEGAAMAGMVMPSATGDAAAASKPTSTQALVCGSEIRGDVRKILALKTAPPARSTFSAGLFTCTYTLTVGTMKLSVNHSTTAADALTYLTIRRREIGAGKPALGLTDHAYLSGTGIVILVKDNETLTVDTTKLPATFGDQHQKRSDLAYEVASDVLGCWTGDDGS